VETIYYGHVPPARDWRPSEGRPEVVLRATQGGRNNIPYTYLESSATIKGLLFSLLVHLRHKAYIEFIARLMQYINKNPDLGSGWDCGSSYGNGNGNSSSGGGSEVT